MTNIETLKSRILPKAYGVAAFYSEAVCDGIELYDIYATDGEKTGLLAAACAMYNDEPLMCLIPIIGGLIGAWGYLTTHAFQLGGNWILHLVVCIAMILIGVLTLLSGQKKK